MSFNGFLERYLPLIELNVYSRSGWINMFGHVFSRTVRMHVCEATEAHGVSHVIGFENVRLKSGLAFAHMLTLHPL